MNFISVTTYVKSEVFDSNSIARHDTNGYTSRFKGVVLLQNGEWGAQILVNRQWIWLGAFKSDVEAAKAYDSASIAIRNCDSHRNFPWTSITAQEVKFQSFYTTDTVLFMIMDGSYPCKFIEYLKMQCPLPQLDAGLNFSLVHRKGEYLCTFLFEKTLTRSDVGKFGRLTIPKKHAASYFPFINNGMPGDESGEVQLVFYDRAMKAWTFRYTYWKSNGTYVLARGWNDFVREKKLRCKDRVIVSKCEYVDAFNTIRRFLMIDAAYDNNGLGENNFFPMKEEVKPEGLVEMNDLANGLVKVEADASPNKGFKLFGVQIID